MAAAQKRYLWVPLKAVLIAPLLIRLAEAPNLCVSLAGPYSSWWDAATPTLTEVGGRQAVNNATQLPTISTFHEVKKLLPWGEELKMCCGLC